MVEKLMKHIGFKQGVKESGEPREAEVDRCRKMSGRETIHTLIYACVQKITIKSVRGGATVLKVGGTKRDSRAKRAKKKIFVPPTFGKVGGVQFFTRAGYEQGNKYHY